MPKVELPKIVGYVLFGHHQVMDLIEHVNRLIDEGWQPLGAPYASVIQDDADQEYHFQAMVKYA